MVYHLAETKELQMAKMSVALKVVTMGAKLVVLMDAYLVALKVVK